MKTTRYRGRAARSQYGFTLIEVTIALMVFTLLTLLFVASIPVSRRSARLNTQYAQAISLCQHKIDQLRAVGYGRLTGTEMYNAEITDSATADGSGRFAFASRDTLTSVLPTPASLPSTPPTGFITVTNFATNVRQVTITITWKNADQNKTSTMEMVALIANTD